MYNRSAKALKGLSTPLHFHEMLAHRRRRDKERVGSNKKKGENNYLQRIDSHSLHVYKALELPAQAYAWRPSTRPTQALHSVRDQQRTVESESGGLRGRER